MLQKVSFLPPEVVLRDVKEDLVPAVGINRLRGHALASKMHVGRVSNGRHVLRKREAGSYFVVAIAWRNAESIVPYLILRHFEAHRLFRKYQADTCAILDGLPQPVAVVNLELKIRASRYF